MLGYAQPLNTSRVKWWTEQAIDAQRHHVKAYEHISAELLKWNGKVVNKRLWDAIYADPWYKANGYHVWHDRGYSGTERLRIEPSPARQGAAYEEIKRKPDRNYRDDNHWNDLQSWSLNVIDRNSATGDRLDIKYIWAQAPSPVKLDELEQLRDFAPEHVKKWNALLADMAHMHEVYSDRCYLLGMLFDLSKDW